MSYLDSASLLMIPSGYKEDKIFSQLPEDGSGDLTFTRASDGTRVNSQGYIERVPWNLAQYSEQLNLWSLVSATVTPDAIAAPNGTNTADKVVCPSGRLQQNIPLISGNTYVASIYAKAELGNFFTIQIIDNVYPATQFNLSTVSVSNSNGALGSIEEVGGGWYLCKMQFTCALSGNVTCRIISSTDGIYAWGAQLVEGPTAKPYIATTNRQDVPRLDYSNGCPCLLLEPQRTNKITYSQDFSAWGMIDVSLSTGYASPDGQNNATKITKTGPNGYLVKSNSVLNNDVRSIYAKTTSGTGTLQLFTYYGNTNNYFTITEEWQRFDLNSVTTSTGELNFYAVDFRGSSTLTEVILWGAQAEAGSYPTSYIPTTSAAVTRLADAAYKTGISSLINSQEGTMFIQTRANTNNTGTSVLSISNGTASNTLYFGFSTTTNSWVCQLVTGGVAQTNFTGTLNVVETIKFIVTYKNNEHKVFINGSNQGIDTSGSVPAAGTFDRFKTDLGQNSFKYYGQLDKVILFPTALTDAQCIELTTL